MPSGRWDLKGVEILELVPPELSLDPSQLQTLVHSSDLELGETVQSALAEIERIKPDRVVFDFVRNSSPVARVVALSPAGAGAEELLLNNVTVLLLDDLTAEQDDLNLHSISHGVIRMEQLSPIYGGERRRLRVIKMRGVQIRGRFSRFRHSARRRDCLSAARCSRARDGRARHACYERDPIDTLVGGGLERGTSTLLMGPSGVGKSTIACTYCHAALARDEAVLVLLFDETKRIFLARAVRAWHGSRSRLPKMAC